ncbi:MAG: ATP-dependent helicase [Clostridiales bacterium]
MSGTKVPIEKLWKINKFKPNDNQKEAILHTKGPLFLTAGPGSGKTRVLLWRTLNLIVYNDVKPEEIFLSTFTEKAAKQLQDGLRSLLGIVTNLTGRPFDLAKMSIGTVHSICQRILSDRRFSVNGVRLTPPSVNDALSQYFKVYNRNYWNQIATAGGFADEESANHSITQFFIGQEYNSRHLAVTNLISLFNRFSEECLDPVRLKVKDPTLASILKMYKFYIESLQINSRVKEVDFSLLQKAAFDLVSSSQDAPKVFKHIIIDEYQDTNSIQERLFFALASGHKNICVVGDDDQALYRFRGATVENLVEFEERCKSYLGIYPKRIDLDINYRSRKEIVDLYTRFISLIDWKKDKPDKGYYRIHDKDIKAKSKDNNPAIVISERAQATDVYEEIAHFVRSLKEEGKIEDYSQCAFLFPYLKNSSRVEGFRRAFCELGIEIYAPRAGRFLEVDEARSVWGLMLKIFGRPHYGNTRSQGLINFRNWMVSCIEFADQLCSKDSVLNQYVKDKQAEIKLASQDYEILLEVAKRKKLKLKDPFKPEWLRDLTASPKLSAKARKNLTNKFFLDILSSRLKMGKPFSLEYVINRSTSLDWSVLDLFYQLNGFKYFRTMYQLAEEGTDEGPICNLGLVSQYLSRFMEEYTPVITAAFLSEDKFVNTFFGSYTYALFRLEESEFEDAEDPFPKGRIPFLTIHQAKGLEFPVVVVGSVFRREREAELNEKIIRDLLHKTGEPLDRISKFDNMRLFYVALSRAQNLLVLPQYTHSSNATEEFKQVFGNFELTKISDFDSDNLPEATMTTEELGKTYSYTADYLSYNKCPRQYMIFRKYDFVPSRSQTMFFGSLVHQTIEDLHYFLLNEAKER